MEQPFMLPILYCQYHACWFSDDLRNQGISRHGILPNEWNILSLASEELMLSVIWVSFGDLRKKDSLL